MRPYPRPRDSLLNALQDRPQLSALLPFEGSDAVPLAFSPDGKTIAAACSHPDRGVRSVVLLDTASRQRCRAPRSSSMRAA